MTGGHLLTALLLEHVWGLGMLPWLLLDGLWAASASSLGCAASPGPRHR